MKKSDTFPFVTVWLFLFVISLSRAQQISTKILPANDIETVSIQGNQIFSIEVITSKSKQIVIKSFLDGEYQNNFQVTSKILRQQLHIYLEAVPFLKIKDDKIAAHKVIAARLLIELPENLNLKLKSDIATAQIEGKFKQLQIELSEGYCYFKGEAKTGIINTINGDIKVETFMAKVVANSRHGKVSAFNYYNVKPEVTLKSINGDIEVIMH